MSVAQGIGLALSGLPLGAMYALQAMGIVLIHKTSGVFNFAQGAIGMFCAFIAGSVGVDLGLPMPLALLAAVAVGVALGVVIERFTIRPVEGALQRTVVTLGWLLGLQGIAQLLFGTVAGRPFLTVFPQSPAIQVDAVFLSWSWDQVGVLLVAGAVALGLGLFFRSRGLGVAMRAVADAPEGASLLGIDVGRVTMVSWGLGAGMAALSGILVTPLLATLDTVGLVIFTIQALAAALIGRLSSLPLTFAGGLALGASQPVLGRLLGLGAGSDELIAFLFVLGALLLRRRVGRRDTGGGGLAPVALRPMPTGRLALASSGGVVLAGAVLLLVLGPGGSRAVAVTAVWSLAVLSLVLLAGVAGQISLCQAVFMGVGGYGAAIAMEAGVPFLVSLLIGGTLAAVGAAVVGLPALRLRGLELAIVTLSLAFAADRYLFASFTPLVSVDRRRPMGRPESMDQLVELPSGAMGTDWRPFAVLAVVLFVLAAMGVAALRRGRTGAAFTALRSSEAATASMGFSVVGVKLRGFALSGFVAGVGGALFAALTGLAGPEAFGFDRSITLLAYAVIAGLGSVPGAVVGGAIVTVSSMSFGAAGEVTSDVAAATSTVITAVLLIVVLIAAPRGIAGLAGDALAKARARFGRPGSGGGADTLPPPTVQEPETDEVDDTVVLLGGGRS